MDKSWDKIFKNYPNKNKLKKVIDEINLKREFVKIFPPKNLVFKNFDLSLFDIKVVILGQDPYHNENEACGLSFSVPDNVKIPKSLQNIFKELSDDLNIEISKTGNLEKWHEQGVFLLNSILTVEKNRPSSHKNIGWEDFTDYIIETISKERKNVVFVLWGNFAKNKKYLIDENKHLIIESPHPSPFSAHKGFFGSKPFSKINSYLKKNGICEIDFKI